MFSCFKQNEEIQKNKKINALQPLETKLKKKLEDIRKIYKMRLTKSVTQTGFDVGLQKT